MNIINVRKKLGLTQADLAQHMNVAPATIQRWETQKRKINVEKLKKLSTYLKCSIEELCGVDRKPENRSPKVRLVPTISWVRAGNFTENESLDQEDTVPVADLNSDSIFALRVVGNSMNLIAPEGSTIIVDYRDKDLREGMYYVAQSHKGITFKRYYSKPPRLEPVSSDPSFQTIFLEENTYVVGRVIKVIQSL